MAQFDVYRNPSKKSRQAYPYLVDVQNALLDDLATRLVVPLTPKQAKQSLYMQKLTPELEVDGETYLFLTQQLSSVPQDILNNPVGTLKHERELLINAIDFAIAGI